MSAVGFRTNETWPLCPGPITPSSSVKPDPLITGLPVAKLLEIELIVNCSPDKRGATLTINVVSAGVANELMFTIDSVTVIVLKSQVPV